MNFSVAQNFDFLKKLKIKTRIGTGLILQTNIELRETELILFLSTHKNKRKQDMWFNKNKCLYRDNGER